MNTREPKFSKVLILDVMLKCVQSETRAMFVNRGRVTDSTGLPLITNES